MEVVEYTQDRSVGWLIHDGPFALRSTVSLAPMEGGPDAGDDPDRAARPCQAFDSSLIERSLRNMKSLIEAET